MSTGVVLSALHEATPGSGKELITLYGRTVLGHLLDCISTAAPGCQVAVLTTPCSSDNRVERFCAYALIPYVCTDLGASPGGVLACAEQFGWEYVVRLNPGAVLLDRQTMGHMISIAETGAFDHVTNFPSGTFPVGLEIDIFSIRFLEEVLRQNPDLERDFSAWAYIRDRVPPSRSHTYQNRLCPEAGHIRCVLETEGDFANLSKIVKRLGPDRASFTLSELARAAADTRSTSPWRGNSGPLLIAEIGGNHEGNFEVAQELTRLAIKSGADCIKFQLYRGDTLVSPVESPDRHKHFRRFELTMDQHVSLAEMCVKAGAKYLASVWDLEMLDPIDPYLPFYKIGSGDLTAWPVLREFAKRGKPILLSTGLATEDEVLATVAQIQAVDARYRTPEWLCLLQCTSMYPIPDSDAQLRVMHTFQRLTGLAVGYSDHTIGGTALRVAAAMGAEVLEFHFTDCREGKTFRDHKVSLTADEVVALKRDLEQLADLQGESCKSPRESEVSQGHLTSFRRGTYLRRSMKAGETIGPQDVAVLRPAHGTDARDADRLVGSKALRDLEAFRALVHNVDYK